MTLHQCLYFGLLPWVVSNAYAWNLSALTSDLSPRTEVLYRSNMNWTDTIPRYNTFGEPTFIAAIKPVEISDVQKIVRFAAANEAPFLASAGGHGFTSSYEALQSGLEIDLGAFDNVSIDVAANKMTIGGGVIFRDVYEPLYSAGKEIQTGSCSCVGMLGATLGAGVGRYQGLHGLIIDALESVQIVTATGDLVTASKTQETDLFWAIRGAGFNFGIVVEATYTIYDLTNDGSVLNADFKFPPSANGTYFEILNSFIDTQPPELSLYTIISVDPVFGPVIKLNAVYTGPEAKGLSYLQPFLNLPILQKNITQLTWNVLTTSAAFEADSLWCIPGISAQFFGTGIAQWDLPTHIHVFNQYINLVETYPAANGSLYWIEYFPTQAVLAVPDTETAYPHRNIRAHVELTLTSTDDSVDDIVTNFGTSSIAAFNTTSGFPTKEVYVSYSGGTDTLQAMYGERKLERLLALKKQWDPQGLFVFNNPLPIS